MSALDDALISTRRLALLLDYPNANAIRLAHRRGSFPISLFRMPGRRGLFAKAFDVQNLLRERLIRQAPCPRTHNSQEAANSQPAVADD